MRTLIVKIGASGDVVRTTVLLRVLHGDIHWLTSSYNAVLLPELDHLHIHEIENLSADFLSLSFDLVINLEEDLQAATLLSNLSVKQTVGVYLKGSSISYTPDSACWFDMSLISRLGAAESNRLKLANQLSYQECILKMIGVAFHGERYLIRDVSNTSSVTPLIGIEERVGKRWPNKKISHFDLLRKKLREDAISFTDFSARSELLHYMADVKNVTAVVCGDTLAMHLALAYNKPCVAFFTCTSAVEIYDYGILKKVVSPRLAEFFYQTNYAAAAANAIDFDTVWKAVSSLASEHQE